MSIADQSQSSVTSVLLPHQQFDIVTKDVFQAFPEDLLRFIMNRTDIKFLEHLESEFVTVERREMDSLIKVLLNDKPVLVHCEIQAGDSTHVDMTRRNIGYIGRCYEKYGLPIFSHVIYLKPNSGRNDPGGYKQEIPGYNFIVEYKVIRLIDVDGQSVLESQQPGLMPFAPLMKPPSGMDTLQWIHQCVETTKSISLDSPTRANLLVGLWVMSGLTKERDSTIDLIREDIVQQSTVYQYIIEKGKKEYAVEAILTVLEARFQADVAEKLKPFLSTIDDLQQLDHLHRLAVQASSLDAFTQKLLNLEY